jgi:hypothetical protein
VVYEEKRKLLAIKILVLIAVFFAVFLAKAFIILPSREFSLEGILHGDFVMFVGKLTVFAAVVITFLLILRILGE